MSWDPRNNKNKNQPTNNQQSRTSATEKGKKKSKEWSG
jgi:hypothetical protein